ncbi:hypothetical protein [Chondromyces apiculatus]|uniref:Uncharacterized protein n=1 Tax=Chondromyces apiculatus DSM 436 TaxID=1192034 RepID=A0A017THW1_9BACT|nr:hypothetical protein [Chondromyces apiculatus]EYF08472.1 Hypothetical protein CAP_4001 [Chondromyces apiculatus DSM 436]
MRRRSWGAASGWWARACKPLAVTLLAGVAASCHEGLDTTRRAPFTATLGDDLYGVLCDRVGASALAEDLTGASYQGVCHPDGEGNYADEVNAAVLPVPSGAKAEEARRLGLSRLEAMVRRRAELIRAVNTAFPDEEIDNPVTEQGGDTIGLHDALLAYSQELAKLYDTHPYAPGGEALLPGSTRSLGRLFAALAESEAARGSFAQMWGRQGYRPTSAILGAIRAALAYPGMRALSTTSTEVIGPGGVAAPAFDQLLAVVKQELLTARSNVAALPPVAVDAATGEPSRPRSSMEILGSLLALEDEAFAPGIAKAPTYIVARDRRGMALPLPGGPFADANGDGLADVDASGRFVAAGAPVAVDPPFVIPGMASQGALDAFGRPEPLVYRYIDTSRTAGAALARTMVPLLDPVQYATEGTPEPWAREHESLMYAMSGAYLLYGDREAATYDHQAEKILPAGSTCAHCTPYQRFRGEASPLADLTHATGQLLADPESDALLLGLRDLLANHEQVVARLIGAALRAREIAAEHDKKAAQGEEPRAELPYEAPIWDEMAVVLGRIADRPGLTTRLFAALASRDAQGTPILLKPTESAWGPGVSHVGETMARFFRNRDRMSYDPGTSGTSRINGAALNLTVTAATGSPSYVDPTTPVDWKAPRIGENKSVMQRSFELIHDAHGATACNKEHAEIRVFGIPFGDYGECSLFQFDNVATFYVDSLLPAGHPKKSKIEIKNGFLSGLLNFADFFNIDVNSLFEDGSGITGLTLTPTTPALNRLVFFGADSTRYSNLPDLDPYRGSSNEDTNLFVSGLIEPASSSVCPKNPAGASQCGPPTDVMRLRDRETIFVWERLGFVDYLRPVITAFADEPCAAGEPKACGEEMFADIVRVLNRHWPGAEHGPECAKSGTPATNPKYCSEAGVASYEPLLADTMETDLVPALVEFSRAVSELSSITVQRGPAAGEVWTGAEVLERMTRVTFSQEYAAQVGMVDRKGSPSTTWVDGTPQAQVTLFSLFADALHGFDARFAESAAGDAAGDAQARKGQWKRARSQIVDALFEVEGEGTEARFKNAATPRLLVAGIDLLREQLNANCPDREAGGGCPWAKVTLGQKMAETMSGPLFAAIMDVNEALRANEPARRELGKMLQYLLGATGDDAALSATLASLTDLCQVVASDDVLSPILKAVAGVASPGGDAEGAGAVFAALPVLRAMADERYDRYHVMDRVLPALVTPMDGGQGPAPIEVVLDVIAEVNRLDAADDRPLAPGDYAEVFGSVGDFLTDTTRGVEQLYTIVQNRAQR